MSETIEFHPALPLGRILPALVERGVRLMIVAPRQGGERPATVVETINFVDGQYKGQTEAGGSLCLVTDHDSGPNYLHGHYLFDGPEGPALLGLTRYGSNRLPQTVIDAIREAGPAYILHECEVPATEFVALYRSEQDTDRYHFRLARPPQPTSGDDRAPSVDYHGSDQEQTRRARPASPGEVEELDRLAREECRDDWGLWLPGSRSIVLLGDSPLPWQREEHDAILARLVGDQAIRDARERERRLVHLGRVLGETGIVIPPDDVEVQRLVLKDLDLALGYSLAGLIDPVDDRRDDAHREARHEREWQLGSDLPGDPDAPRVGPDFVGRMVIGGGIKGINDETARKVDARITEHEARVLMRYWFERGRDIFEGCYLHDYSGSSEWREMAYSEYRLDALEPFVAKDFKEELTAESQARQARIEKMKSEAGEAEGPDDGINPDHPDA